MIYKKFRYPVGYKPIYLLKRFFIQITEVYEFPSLIFCLVVLNFL